MLYNINMDNFEENTHQQQPKNTQEEITATTQEVATEFSVLFGEKKQIRGKNVSYKFTRALAWKVVGIIVLGFFLLNFLGFTLFKQKEVLSQYDWSSSDEFDESRYKTLSTDENGDFRILQLTDLHILNGVGVLDVRTFDLAKRLVDYSDPDLIVLTGDIVFTWNNERTFKKVVDFFDEICKERKIFWCAVFGNHDETGYSDESVLASVMEKSKYCLFEVGPTNLNDGKYGNCIGNYAINVADARGNGKCSLVFMDSNRGATSADEGVYAPISRDTVSWYEWFVKGMAQSNGGNTVPSLAFFHIPLVQSRLMTGDWEMGQNGYNEKVYSSDLDTGLFAKIEELKSTLATFSGHDHNNYYQGRLYGSNVLLTACVSCGYTTYGDTHLKGGRVIDLNITDNQVTLDTNVVLVGELPTN